MNHLNFKMRLATVFLLTVSVLSFNTQADTHSIKIGLLPYLSPDLLLKRYAPFINYVGEKLNRKTVVATAPNFPTYVKRAHNNRYDLYVTAPHFAALAEQEYGFKRIARLSRELDGAMVVHIDSPITNIEELKGKKLAAPDHLAIITILGELALKDHGIDPVKDIDIKSAPSHNTALLEVINKRADAAVVSAAVFENMDPNLKKQLRLIFSTSRVPHMMFLASPMVSDKDYKKLKETILNFTAEGDGKEYFKESGYVNMEPITEDDMKKMKAMLPLLTPRLN